MLVYTAKTNEEAEIIRLALEAAGIPAARPGMTSAMAAYDGGLPGGNLVEVAEEDFERARQFILDHQHEPEACPNCGYNLTGLPEPRCPECGEPFPRLARVPDWLCPECGEQIEGQFTACWKCGREKPDVRNSRDLLIHGAERAPMMAEKGDQDVLGASPDDLPSCAPAELPSLFSRRFILAAVGVVFAPFATETLIGLGFEWIGASWHPPFADCFGIPVITGLVSVALLPLSWWLRWAIAVAYTPIMSYSVISYALAFDWAVHNHGL